MLNRGTGRRKNAIARVRLQPGEGRVTVNEKDPLAYLGRRVLEMAALAPLRVTGTQRKFDISTTVIDLRSASEVANKPNPFADGSGPAYVHRELIDDANMRQIGDSPDMFERYLMILDNRPQAFHDIFDSVAEADGAILFHCYAGKDRTGMIAAMLLALAGVTPDDIAADYGETDLRLAKQYEKWITEAAPERREAFRQGLGCPPGRILGVLEHLPG